MRRKVARLEAAPVAGDQLCRQRRHNLLPILRAPVVQDFAVDLLSDAPKQKHRGAVRLTRERAAGFLDQTRHCGEKVAPRREHDGAPALSCFGHRRFSSA